MLKFHDTKPKFIPDLITVSASSKNLILIDLSWFYGQAPVRKLSCDPSLCPRGRRGDLNHQTLAVPFLLQEEK